MYYLCRREQENLRSMTKETFDVAVDSTGKRYVNQKIDELDKNHRDLTTGAVTHGRMYEQPGKIVFSADIYFKFVWLSLTLHDFYELHFR